MLPSRSFALPLLLLLCLAGPLPAAEPAAHRDADGDPLPPRALARLGQDPRGHATGLAFSPDGKELATGSEDGGVRLWKVTDALQGRLKPRTLPAARSSSRVAGGRVDWSGDGKLIAFAVSDEAVALWDPAAGKEVRRLADLEGCQTLAFSPDGKLLAIADAHQAASSRPAGRVILFEAASGRRLRALGGHGDTVRALAFSRDGKRLAVAGDGIHVWEAARGRRLRHGRGTGVVDTLAFASDGRTLIYGYMGAQKSGGQVVVAWDVEQGDEWRRLEGAVGGAVLSPDNRLLAVGGLDGLIHLWDFTTDTEVARLAGHAGGITALAFSPDGRLLASGGKDTTVLLWDVAGLPRAAARRRLSADDLARLWDDLGKADAARGQRALWALVEDPDAAIPFLGERIPGTAGANRERVARLIEQLDDDAFAVRQQAQKSLEKLGETAVQALRDALARQPTVEQRRRLEQLLAPYRSRTLLRPPGDTLRAVRAIEGLERIGTARARRVLEEQVKGPPSGIAEDARAAVQRLERLKGARPEPPARADVPDDPLPAGVVARLGTSRLRHGRPVCGLAFSPDDRLLASTALMIPRVQENVVHLWDTATGEAVRVCRSKKRDAWAVAFSPDGTRLASAGWNGNLVLWETATGKQLAEKDDHLFFWGTYPAVAFSADGKSVRACGENNPLHVCSPAGDSFRNIPLPEHHRYRPVFSADGSLLVSSSDGVLRVTDTATGKELLRLGRHPGDLKAAAFSHDGRYLATTGGKRELYLWELATAELVCTLPDLGEESLAFAPDGRTLAAASFDGKIRLWDVVTRKPRRLGRVGWHPSALVFSHDGKKLAVGCQDGLIHLFDTAAGKEPLPSAALPGALLPLAFLGGGKRLAVFAPGRPWANGLYLAEIDRPHEKGRPWTARLGERVEMENRPAALSPNGKLAFLVGAYETALWSTERAIPVRRIAVNEPSAAAFAPDGKVLATAERGRVALWNVSTGKLRHRLVNLKCREPALAFSPDSKLLATIGSGTDDTLRLWDVATGKEDRHFDILPGEKDVGRRSLTFSPDGKLLAVADDYGLIQLWDLATRQHVGGMRGFALAFAPDGKVIAVGGADGLIRLHDARKGNEVRQLSGHEGKTKALVWSPDGRLLASGAEDHTVLLWDVDRQ